MSAAQYLHEPRYRALILRRTYADLRLSDAIMARAQEWWQGSHARWSERDKTLTFRSGATITFGYLDSENDKLRYQGSAFQFIGFDELTHFTRTQYLYLFSRLRKTGDLDVPLRMRAAGNPGGIGHQWVKERFITDEAAAGVLSGNYREMYEHEGRAFVPSRIEDNPHLDREEYESSLEQLDYITRAQLRGGDWNIVAGALFKPEWFEIVEEVPASVRRRVRYWDKAGTQGAGDYSAGVRMSEGDGIFYVENVVRGQWSAANRNKVMDQTAATDPPGTDIWAEQEPGSGGKESAEITVKRLAGFNVHTELATGTKWTRAQPFSAQCEAGNVKLVRGDWNRAYIDELTTFDGQEAPGKYDDQVDASSGAFNKLARPRKKFYVA